MYLGMLSVLCGAGFWSNIVSGLLLIPCFILTITLAEIMPDGGVWIDFLETSKLHSEKKWVVRFDAIFESFKRIVSVYHLLSIRPKFHRKIIWIKLRKATIC